MEELTIYNVEVREIRQQLRVLVETPYGVENLGLSLSKKYLDVDTDKPKWLSSTKRLLEKKFNKSVNILKIEELSNNGKPVIEL